MVGSLCRTRAFRESLAPEIGGFMVFPARKFRLRTVGVGVLAVGLMLSGSPAFGMAGGLRTAGPGQVPVIAPMADFGTPTKIPVMGPSYVSASPDGSKVFAASTGGDLSVIDTATDHVTLTADLDYISAMKVSPDGSKVFLGTHLFEHHVTIVDAATATPSAKIAVDGPVQDLAVSPDGSTLYVTTQATEGPSDSPGAVHVINVASASVLKVIPVGRAPGKILLTPDGAKAFVSHGAEPSVSVINTATKTVSSTIPLGVASLGGSMSPDGSRIYYPKLFGGIAIVAVASNTVIGEIATQSDTWAAPPVFTPDGRRAFFVDKTPDRQEGRETIRGDSFLTEIDLDLNTLSSPISLTNGGPSMYSGPLNLTMSADGTRLFVVGTGITVLNLPSLKAAGAIDLDFDVAPGTLTMLPDGSKGYFSPGTQRNYLWALPTPRDSNAWKDYNSDGATDVLARDSSGSLWLYPGDANEGWLPRTQVGSGWNVMNLIVAAGDFNGDGNSDALARDAAGDLWLYPGDGDSDWLPRSKVGVGWNAMTAVVAPGDFDADGKADVLARDAAGDLWLYPGNGTGGWLPRAKIGSGWNEMTAIMGPGNNVRPGNDVLARDAEGILWLYERDQSNEWLPRVLVGVGWNVMSAIVTPGDFDGDDVPDVLARDSSGVLWLYPGSGSGGYAPRVQVGAGWNVMTAIL